MTEPTILHAVFTALPEKGEEVAALLRDFAEVVRAEEGNVLFDATRLVDDPTASSSTRSIATTRPSRRTSRPRPASRSMRLCSS